MFGHPFAIECRKSHIDRMRLPELKERVYAEKNTNLPHLREASYQNEECLKNEITSSKETIDEISFENVILENEEEFPFSQPIDNSDSEEDDQVLNMFNVNDVKWEDDGSL
ncbi:hypothetical protein PGB90_004595 [Kerria lacca]